MTVYCLVELDGGTIADPSLRALTLARELSQSFASSVTPDSSAAPGPGVAADSGVAAVVFADAAGVPVTELAAYGAADVYVVAVNGYAPQAWARAIAGLVPELAGVCVERVVGATISTHDHGPDAVLAAGTDHGNEVMAHLGAITGLPMAANCVSAGPSASGAGDSDTVAAGLAGVRMKLTRQRWAGLLLEESELDAPVALLTVATDAVSPKAAEVPPDATVHQVTPSLPEADLVIRAEEAAAGVGGASLATARVVVGGGRGVGSADGFAPLEELAELLGGVVGVSRVVTSEGWRPHAQQVGQTGTKITPDLYLACGISGAIQHIAGCSGAKHIIAINTDPAAPMMSRADYAVIGDLHEVIPALVVALRAISR